MSTTSANAIGAFVDALTARDFARACGLLDPAIDFRAMTPRRVWEAEGPPEVEQVLRTWLEDPEEQITSIEALEGGRVEDTLRAAWRVCGRGPDGPFVFEQQAFAREQEGRIGWLRIMCTGKRPTPSNVPE